MLLVVACFSAGAVLHRLWPSARAVAPWADRGVLWVALPALILRRLPALELGADAAVPVGVAWGALVVAVASVSMAGRWAGWDRPTMGALLLVTPLGNTSFLGFAAVAALLGEDHVPAAIAYDQLGSFLALVTWGTVVVERYGSDRGAGSVGGSGFAWRSMVRRVLTFPPFVALCFSVPLRWWELPDALDRVLAVPAWFVGPLAMVATGLRFQLRVGRRVLGPAAWCLGTRLVALPALALVGSAVAGGGTSWESAVLESAMPPMVTAGIVATAAGLDEDLATTVVGWGLLLSFLTLPVWSLLVR